jgi:hypothetical protein
VVYILVIVKALKHVPDILLCKCWSWQTFSLPNWIVNLYYNGKSYWENYNYWAMKDIILLFVNFVMIMRIVTTEGANDIHCVYKRMEYNVRFQVSYLWLRRTLSCIYVCDGVWIGELDLLTTCTHHTELQVITALFLISLLYKSQHTKRPLACSVSNSCSLAMASNSGDSSASHAHIVTVRWIFRNWTHSAGLGFLLYSLGPKQEKTLPPTVFLLLLWVVA